jgi:hypothetical protein
VPPVGTSPGSRPGGDGAAAVDGRAMPGAGVVRAAVAEPGAIELDESKYSTVGSDETIETCKVE